MNMRRKPEKREKILFGILLTVIMATFFKSIILVDIEEINIVRSQLDIIKQQPFTTLPKTETKKRWIGTTKDVRDASETAFDPEQIQNIKIIKNQFSPIKIDQSRQIREVSLSVMGDFYALKNYLSHLENMPAPLVIHTLSIQKSAADSDVLNLEISGELYGAN